MPFTLSDIGLGVAVPVLVGCCLFRILHWLWSGSRAESLAAPFSFAAAYVVGYGLLRPGPLLPEKQWHWLPMIGVAAALCETSVLLPRHQAVVRAAMWCGLSAGAVVLLTPVRETLQPPRPVLLIVWPCLVVLTTWRAESFFRHRNAFSVSLIVCLQFLSACVVNFLSGSLRYSQLGLIGLAAALAILAGVLLPARSTPGAPSTPRTRSTPGARMSVTQMPVTQMPVTRMSVHRISLVAGVLLWGVLLTGYVNASVELPLLSYLLIPVAPGCLWISSLVQKKFRHASHRAVVADRHVDARPAALATSMPVSETSSSEAPTSETPLAASTQSWLGVLCDVAVVAGLCLISIGVALFSYLK